MSTPTRSYVTCPVGICIGNEKNKIQLLLLLLPQDRAYRKAVIKRMLIWLYELRNWFTMDNNRFLRNRFADFLNSLPYVAYNDFLLEDIEKIDGEKKVNDMYELLIGNKIFSKDVLKEEFLIDTTIELMGL